MHACLFAVLRPCPHVYMDIYLGLPSTGGTEKEALKKKKKILTGGEMLKCNFHCFLTDMRNTCLLKKLKSQLYPTCACYCYFACLSWLLIWLLLHGW